MISQRKLEANRRNALKSTGPRTEAGKRICSMNAVKHGLFSSRHVVPKCLEEPFQALREKVFRELNPQGQPEQLLRYLVRCLKLP